MTEENEIKEESIANKLYILAMHQNRLLIQLEIVITRFDDRLKKVEEALVNYYG